MRQYCRYCSWIICGDVCYCQQKKKELTEQQVCQSNTCRLFDFTPEDALGTGHMYTPRPRRNRQIKGQMTLEEYNRTAIDPKD
jgi:hypothetical protein